MIGSPEPRWLAFDSSTDVLSLAVARGKQVWTQTLPGGAQASHALIPALLALLAEAELPLASLDAIVFGRGPGSFTGLRIGLGISWTAVIVSEMVAVKSGLGYVLWDAYYVGRMDIVLADMVSIGAMGYLSDRLIVFTERRVLRWRILQNH